MQVKRAFPTTAEPIAQMGAPAVTPNALTHICHTPAKKTYEFIGPLARIALPMQLDELIHPNRHKTHCTIPFPIV
jgi:hypothetical protein